jgi:hypothetical protein
MKITQPMIEPVILALDSFDNLKVAEISVMVAQGLGYPTVEACGSYKSGKLVLPSQVTNTLNGLKDQGKVIKVGHGRWTKPHGNVAVPTPPPQPKVEMVVEPQAQEVEIDLSDIEIEIEPVEVDPSEMLYDLSDRMTLDFFISQTACFGKYVKSDKACGSCLLAPHCSKAKALAKAERKQAKQAEVKQAEVKQEAGIKIDIPQDADLSNVRHIASATKPILK